VGLGLETPGEITSGAKHAAQRKTRVDRFGPSALGWCHPAHSIPLRTTMSLTMVVSKDTYLWTLEVYYRYMSKLIYPSMAKERKV